MQSSFLFSFLAAITNHIMLGSHHSSLIFTKVLVPMKDAVAVRRSRPENKFLGHTNCICVLIQDFQEIVAEIAFIK